MNPLTPFEPTKDTGGDTDSTAGGTIGIIIIISLTLLGGFYFWNKQLEKNKINTELQANELQNNSSTLPH